MADLTITITIPDAARPDYVDAYCEAYGWRSVGLDGPRPAFAREHTRMLARSVLREHRRRRAEQAALASVTEQGDDGITAS